MSEQVLVFEGRKYVGLSFELGNMPLLILKARKGYVACSYVNKLSAEHLGDVAAFVCGVKSFDDLYQSKIREMTAWAEEAGIREGMSVKKALEIMDRVETE
ncbi:MAG: DUF1805 domain-containing protein [Candidatus Micrarchaeota archaeon]